MNSSKVKKLAAQLGADICGIAPVDRFTETPKGFNPVDVLPSCKSVIVFGCKFNASTMNAESRSPYTVARNTIARELDGISCKLAAAIADQGFDAVPIGSIGPDEYCSETEKEMGPISLKHAAVLAGLGKMGKNTLLVNDRYGNMLWLSAVLTSVELSPDPIAPYDPCPPQCRLCIESCLVSALDGISIDQKACRSYAFGSKNGGEWMIHCFTCRKVCPNSLGVKKR